MAKGGYGQFLRDRDTPCTYDSRFEYRRLTDTHWIVSKKAKLACFEDLLRATRDVSLKPRVGEGGDSVSGLIGVAGAGGDPVHAAGFRNGDSILTVNGSSVTTMKRMLNLVHEIRASDRVTVRVQRVIDSSITSSISSDLPRVRRQGYFPA